MDKDQKHNKKRTKEAQKNGMSKGTKRRVNITISGDVWDKLDDLKIESKSEVVETLIKELLKKNGAL